ncbi:hypothetical protein QJS10_CPB18g01466 [Acorus calamus]|uniref:Uncharacterized protein n=1 Tax=Acorus calamus TaxID=4465 RepID=A0AAV9CLG0_ACOCL|nr:hypothetical protein QJS10_CPB18g01466 [Acorus calamus]
MSEPTSVQERRRRLLQQLGLTGDPSLSRLKLTAADEDDDDDGGDDDDDDDVARFGCRSASYDEIRTGRGTDSGAFARSRSESSVDSSGPPPIGGLRSSPPRPVHNHDNGSDGGVEEGSDGGGGGRERPSHRHRRYCTIKNLDNGEEFVVNGLREDGTWDKLREVGTGRQLTAEEFHMSVVGHSPIVQELMRRQNFEESSKDSSASIENGGNPNGGGGGGSKWRRRGGWLKSIKNTVTGVAYKERRSSDERDTSSEKGGRRSSSATDDSQDTQFHHHINGGCGPERTKVRQYGKSCKELTALYMSQDIQAHHGSIWAIRFSLDGRYLASAGEDRVIHVWQVSEAERKGELLVVGEEGNLNQCSASPEPVVGANGSYLERSKRGKGSNHRKSVSLDQIAVPEHVFALSEKPVCSFSGHFGDVLDLSWSKSLQLLSSSMDKTVRLWNMSSSSCLKIFSHSDYVTSIQFNPVDDRYFISGSLDAKVRIWSIPDRKVVDWNDLHEMVTAACYTPDGQGALVGSHKGTCRLYSTADNKLQEKKLIDLQNKKKKSHLKKITGFQFAPGCSPQVLVTSADSRIRVIDGVDLVHKFKGFRNTSSQISASLTANGKYVICASEDSHVYVWRYDSNSRPNRTKVVVSITQSYEHFHCQDVSVAIPWPGFSADDSTETNENQINGINEDSETDPIFLGDESTEHGSSYHHINGTNGSTDYKRTSSANGTMNTKRTSSVSVEENLIGTANKGVRKAVASFPVGEHWFRKGQRGGW